MPDLHDYGTGAAPKPPQRDYVPKVPFFPQTLDDIMKRAGPYADAVKVHLEWGAVVVWLMKEGEKVVEAAGLPFAVANLSALLTRKAVEREAGWPHYAGENVMPEIYSYSPDSQCEARRSANEVHALWQTSGRPYLRDSDCKFAFQYLVFCIRKGIIPPIKTMGEIPPREIQ